jgi:DNA repair protein RecO (recombination protein O)
MTIARTNRGDMRVNLQPGYVIHSRPYRDSSALLDVFTAEFGRISMVARGARRPSRKGSGAALLQPFIPLLLSFSGRSELKTLVAIEPAQAGLMLRGERMFSGMYMNELLVRLLHRHDAHPVLFSAYDRALKALAGSVAVDAVLRPFEISLLDELGYNLALTVDGASGEAVHPARWYRYDTGYGLVAGDNTRDRRTNPYPGSDLLAIAGGDFAGPARLTAKRLLREALAVHLGDTPLRSRELFRKAQTIPLREKAQVSAEGNAGEYQS